MAGNSNSGRRRTPIEITDLRGTTNASRVKAGGDQVPTRKIVSLIQCRVPGEGKMSRWCRSFFKTTCQHLIDMKVLTMADLPTVLMYAQQYELYLKARADVEENGMYRAIYDEDGNLKKYAKNPANEIMTAALNSVTRCSAVLGLSPTDRQKLRVPTEEKKTAGWRSFIAKDAEDGPEEQ